MPPPTMPKDSNPLTAPQSGIMNNSAGQQHKSKDGDLRSALLRGGQGSGVGRRRHVPKSKISERTKVRVVAARCESGGSSGSEPGSDLVEVSDHEAPWSVCRPEPPAGSHCGGVYYTPSLTSGSSALSSDDSLASSIDRFRDDFDTFKCQLRIFGESLALCKCIARDFGGRLRGMERRLRSLETRHTRDKTHNNYTAIIQKNKLLSTKTKEYVQKLQKCGTETEMREVAGRICRSYLPGLWKLVQPNELSFSKVTGGLSNFIYLVGLPSDLRPLYRRLESAQDEECKALREAVDTAADVPNKVLLRIYGQVHGERAMDAIVTESVIFTLLSERRLGPRLYGVFSGGRIEEYIPARSLTTRELSEPAISMKIAEKTAAIHSMEIPLSKEGTYLWKTMGKWLKTVHDDVFSNGIKGKNETEQACISRLKAVDFAAEIEWLKKFLAAFDSPVVFCHNDLQEGNILYLEGATAAAPDEYDTDTHTHTHYQLQELKSVSLTRRCSEEMPSPLPVEELYPEGTPHPLASRTALTPRGVLEPSLEDSVDSVGSEGGAGEPKLYLIDFEYCAYNYRAFDIANHFAEWAFDYTAPQHPFYTEHPDYSPTLEQKEIFIKEYLKHYNALTCDSAESTEPDIDAVNKLLAEVDAFALASHLFWTLWSIVNASKSQIPFGYWEYGVTRLEWYQRLKQEVIKKDKFGIPLKRKIEEVDI